MTAIDFSELEPCNPPPLGYRPLLFRNVQRANAILLEHGAVSDGKPYPARHLARWRAQRMISLLVAEAARERWEVRERTWSDGDGWHWSVQHTRGEQNGRGGGAAER